MKNNKIASDYFSWCVLFPNGSEEIQKDEIKIKSNIAKIKKIYNDRRSKQWSEFENLFHLKQKLFA